MSVFRVPRYRTGNGVPWWTMTRWGVLHLSLVVLASCTSAQQEESRVETVEAKIDGLTCPTCVAPLEASLRRHFGEGAEIDIDDGTDIARVTFALNQEFSEEALREATSQTRMKILELKVWACGRIYASGDESWFVAGTSRFLLSEQKDMPTDVPVCLEGELTADGDRSVLKAVAFARQAGSARLGVLR